MAWLEREFEETKMQDAIFYFGSNKAPNLDGFPMTFFQRFWDVTKVDIMEFMREFHLSGKLSKNVGASFIAVIPKKNGAECLNDFRPISLIGSMYKILAKVLVGRSRKFLSFIISPSQGAFVHGRLLLDGVLVANECIHSRVQKRAGFAMQVRFGETYDRVDWDFLRRMGFGVKWRCWIHESISFAKFSILDKCIPT